MCIEPASACAFWNHDLRVASLRWSFPTNRVPTNCVWQSQDSPFRGGAVVCVWLLLVAGLGLARAAFTSALPERITNEELLDLRIFLIAFILLLVGAAVFLVVWEVPAPTQQKEIVIPPERFQR